jgi:hypothetical protein
MFRACKTLPILLILTARSRVSLSRLLFVVITLIFFTLCLSVVPCLTTATLLVASSTSEKVSLGELAVSGLVDTRVQGVVLVL